MKRCRALQGEWLGPAAAAVNERIARYSAKEQRFNLMAVVHSRAEALRERLVELAAERAALAAGGAAEGAATRLAEVEAEEGAASAALGDEEEKHRRWRDENLRRRTDFIPFAFNLLKGLAQAQQLAPLLDQAGARKA